MRRTIFSLTAAVSALLCAFCLGFGLLGYRESGETRIEWIGRSHAAVLLSYDGALVVILSSGWPARDWVNERHVRLDSQPTPLTYYPGIVADGTLERQTLTDGASRATITYRGLRTNLLFAIVFTAAWPAAWGVVRAKIRRHRRAGHCRRCGYDLRATPERCPECGVVQGSGRRTA